MASTDARPVPIKNTAFRCYWSIFNSSGKVLTGGLTGLAATIIQDGVSATPGGTPTEVGTTGTGYIDLTSGEMNKDCVGVVIKATNTNAVDAVVWLYPQETGDIKVDVQSFNGTAGTFSAGRPEVNMTHIAGSVVSAAAAQLGVNVVNFGGSAGTFASGRPEANMTHIAGSTVSTSAAQLGVNVVNMGGSAGTFASGRPEVNATHAAGTAWNSGAITAATLADDASDEIRDKVAVRTTLRGTCTTGGTTTSITTSAMSPATSVGDQLKGRIVVFDHNTTTAALRGQATDITASSASATPTLTVTALTTAPSSGDTFTVV